MTCFRQPRVKQIATHSKGKLDEAAGGLDNVERKMLVMCTLSEKPTSISKKLIQTKLTGKYFNRVTKEQKITMTISKIQKALPIRTNHQT